MIRRFVSFYVAICIGYFSCVSPARALAPVAVLAAPQVVSAGATYAVAALAGLIGLAGLYLQVQDADGNMARVPLKDDAGAVPPAPSAAPTATGSQGTDTTAQETACSGFAAWKLSGGLGCGTTWAIVPLANGTQYYCRAFYASGAPCSDSENKSIPQTLVCPSGYTKSGSSCVLSNPRQAAPDKKCDLQFSSGKYLYYNDADCPSGPSIDHSKAVPGLRSDGDVVFVPGKDANGNPLLVKVLQQRDNQTGLVTERVLQVFKQSGANVDTTTITLTPDAVVKSATQTSSPGLLTSPATSPSAANTPDTATTTPQAQTDPTKQAQLQFPDDYARENTSQATRSGVEQLHRDLTDTTNVDDPLQPDSSLFADSFFKDTFTGLKGWQLPSHTSTCPIGSLDLFGQSFTIDSHCTLINNHWGALQAAMAVVWSLMALFIVLRA